MFSQTTIVLLGRNLFRVFCNPRIISPPTSSYRNYHPILDDIQAFFSKKTESLQQASPHSIPSQPVSSKPSFFDGTKQLKSITRQEQNVPNVDSKEPEGKGPKSSQESADSGTTSISHAHTEDEQQGHTPNEPEKTIASLEQKEERTSSSESLLAQLSHEGVLLRRGNHVTSHERELRGLLRDLLNHKEKRTDLVLIHKVSHLANIVRAEPELAKELWDSGCVHFLNRLTKSRHSEVRRKSRLVLALVGHPPPYPKRGLRILAIDGGGTRALIPITILRHLEKVSGTNLFEMFDLVCGTSSGALSANFLCVERGGAVALERVCRRLGDEVFNTGEITQKVAGFSKLFTKHAFYDSSKYEDLLRQYPKSDWSLLDTAAEANMPKLVFVSTAVNWPALKPFVFRNYYHRPGVTSHYRGTSEARVWEALRATSAAPGYFEEFKFAQFVHHDGALLTNNPAAVGLHEARLLWGSSVPIQCILSLGTGKYPWVEVVPEEEDDAKNSSPGIVDKLQGMLTSVTDSETVHTILKDILPPTVYFRFNPVINQNVPIDECDPRKLDQLVHLTEDFIEEHKYELRQVVDTLQSNKTTWMKLKVKSEELLQDIQLHLYHRIKL